MEDPGKLVQRVISAVRAVNIHPAALQALMRVGFALIDRQPSAVAKLDHAAAATAPAHSLIIDLTSDQPQQSNRTLQELCMMAGAKIVDKLFKEAPETGRDVVTEILARVNRGGASAGEPTGEERKALTSLCSFCS